MFRSILASLPLSTYIVTGLAATALLGLFGGMRRVKSKRTMPTAKSTDAIWRLPIGEAIQPAHGGNGLASRPLDVLPLSQVIVQTPGMECVVVDGNRIVRRTRRWLRLSGTATARRILLSPEPRVLKDIRSLSCDQLETTLSVAITYRVSDPCAALVQAPLDEFTHLAQGVIGEHIHSHEQRELLNDRGSLRMGLEKHLREAKTLAGYQIIEVAVLAVDGDRRLIEIGTQTRVETMRGELVKAQGGNSLDAAQYDIRIERLRAQLSEWAKMQEHGRRMEGEILRLNAENIQAVIGAITAIAQQGSDAGSAVEGLQKLMAAQAVVMSVSASVETITSAEEKMNHEP